jgi:hypothetical protein
MSSRLATVIAWSSSASSRDSSRTTAICSSSTAAAAPNRRSEPPRQYAPHGPRRLLFATALDRHPFNMRDVALALLASFFASFLAAAFNRHPFNMRDVRHFSFLLPLLDDMQHFLFRRRRQRHQPVNKTEQAEHPLPRLTPLIEPADQRQLSALAARHVAPGILGR